MTIQDIINVILLPSIIFGLGVGGVIFLFGLGINVCLRLFTNS